MPAEKRGILVVSFGTCYQEAREKTINKIEADIRKAYPKDSIYTAFTSKRVRMKAAEAEKNKIYGVSEALEEMLRAGVKKVYVQPTFIIEGVQNRQMIEEAMIYQKQFYKMVFGKPLLTSHKDYQLVIKAFTKKHSQHKEDEAVILVGHGANDFLSRSFAVLQDMLNEEASEHYYVASLRSYPSLTQVIEQLKENKYRKIFLYPLMLTAGYHTYQDLLGQGEQSWKQLLEKEGYEVEISLAGLGEYADIRQIYVAHIDEMLSEE